MADYQTLTPGDTRAFSAFLSSSGQLPPPMVQLVEDARAATDELVDVAGRACLQAILEASAAELARPRTPGKRSGNVGYHGHQDGIVHLKGTHAAGPPVPAATRDRR